MIHDILEKKIEDAWLAETGRTLFREHMPADIAVGVMFRAPLDGIAIDPHMPGWHKPRMQMILRHTDPVEGEKMANDIIKAVLVEGGNELHPATSERGRVLLTLFYPEATPTRFPRLEGDELEFSVYFRTAFAIEPAWR